jgi:hypothetical protein
VIAADFSTKSNAARAARKTRAASMSRATKVFAVLMLLVGMSTVGLASATAAAATAVVPYGSGGYRYLQVAVGGGDPAFDEVGFDDSAFGTGAAPFGLAAPEFDCRLSSSTAWSPNTDLLVRRTVVLPAGTTDVVIHGAVDNDIQLFWNGSPIGDFENDGCAARDSVEVAVPDGLLTSGDNVLAVRASDDGGETFLDLEVSANLPPDCSSVSMDHTTLWPPSHDLRLVTAAGGTDPEGQDVALEVVSVTQDEPLDATGDGNVTPDADRGGLPADQVRLRAERSGLGDGRVYRVAVTATDAGGARCSTTIAVGVPHDMGKGRVAIDSTDVVVDSFGAGPPVLPLDPDATALPSDGVGELGGLAVVVTAATPPAAADAAPLAELPPAPPPIPAPGAPTAIPAPVEPTVIPAPVDPQTPPPAEPTTPAADERQRGKSGEPHEPRGATRRADTGPR